jgi:hypothetical protein
MCNKDYSLWICFEVAYDGSFIVLTMCDIDYSLWICYSVCQLSSLLWARIKHIIVKYCCSRRSQACQGNICYCHAHNNWGPRNSFQRFLVPVYYWKTVEKPETDPQLFWVWQYFDVCQKKEMQIICDISWASLYELYTSVRPRGHRQDSGRRPWLTYWYCLWVLLLRLAYLLVCSDSELEHQYIYRN